MSKKRIFLFVLIALIAIFGIYKGFIQKKKPTFTLAKVSRGTVSQEVSETGTVGQGEEVKLAFKNSGKIEKVLVKIGDSVKSGDTLVQLNTTQLAIQLEEAEADVTAQEAKLLELKNGTRPEEIEVSKTLLSKAEAELDNLYSATGTILKQAYNLVDNAITQQISSLLLYRQEVTIPYYDLTYKNCDDKVALDATAKRKISDSELTTWQSELQNLGNSQTLVDEAIKQSVKHLSTLQNFLVALNKTFSIGCKLTSEQLTTIITLKAIAVSALTNMNTAISSIDTQEKAIKAQKLTVQNYQDELDLELAGATPEQINYQDALFKQAEAAANLLKNQISESALRSPVDGKIIQIDKNEGEIAAAAESVISLLPDSPFQVKVDIYEEDIVKLAVGNSVDINITAFPDQVLKGKVIFINPAEKLVEGVVYYECAIDFENPPQGVKTGMTADVVIKAASKENVLVIPQVSITKKDSKNFVQVLKGKKIEEREIKIGLEGSNGMVEITSGLQEGEEIVINQ